MKSQALIPIYIEKSNNKLTANIVAVGLGVVLMSLLAQITIHLPWTPVPITGQTFGVALTALAWGRKRALTIMGTYLLIGAAGLPVFAMGGSGLTFGPTMGYLIGMVGAAAVVGTLADRGWTKTFGKALGAAFIGSFIIFSCGLAVLSFFVPKETLLVAGFYPFILGDLIKNSLAATLASAGNRFKTNN